MNNEVKKCLVVDDDPVSREIIQILMNDFHIKLMRAANGREAKDLCESDFFDCVILDIEMPLVSGFEFLESNPFQSYKQKPVIFILSARDYDTDKSRASELGVKEFIVKPVLRENLKEKLTMHGVIS